MDKQRRECACFAQRPRQGGQLSAVDGVLDLGALGGRQPAALHRLIDRLDVRWDTETLINIPTTMLPVTPTPLWRIPLRRRSGAITWTAS